MTPSTWFDARGWRPFEFQREVWSAMAAGESGLLHATTGSGKTYAVWFGALARAAALGVPLAATQGARTALLPQSLGVSAPPPLGVLWLTPMRALAADSARAMQAPLDDLGLSWSIGIRTGDTAPTERAKQDRRFPTALVTTPESLSLMLTREGAEPDGVGLARAGGRVQQAALPRRHRRPDLALESERLPAAPREPGFGKRDLLFWRLARSRRRRHQAAFREAGLRRS